jgi:hypothetical protein
MSKDFSIVVANSPKLFDGKIDLTSERLSLQTAILYADKVQFFSLAYSVIRFLLNSIDEMNFKPLLAFTISDEKKLFYGLSFIYSYLRQQVSDKDWEKGGFSKNDEKLLLDLIKSNSNHLKEQFEQTVGDSLREIELALELDFVTLQKFNTPLDNIGDWRNARNEDALNIIKEYLTMLSDVSKHNTYPLFDSYTARSINTFSDNSSITWKSKGIQLLHDLLNRLPLFENATVSDIVDIRKDLQKPLVRFRAAILEFASGIEKEVWDEDFPYEAEKLFRQKVEPAILDIEEQVKANRSLVDLLPTLTKSNSIATTSVVGLGLAYANILPDIMATSLGLTVGVASEAYSFFKKRREEYEAIQRNQLYFYYKVEQDLKRKK